MTPFRIEGPAQISFSGGRSSGMLLCKIVEAHGGTLPEDVFVLFANTGKEREETLEFIIAQHTGIDWGSISPRMVTLEDVGLIARTKERRKVPGHSTGIVWEITPDGRDVGALF